MNATHAIDFAWTDKIYVLNKMQILGDSFISTNKKKRIRPQKFNVSVFNAGSDKIS